MAEIGCGSVWLKGKNYLLVNDYCSRYPKVEPLNQKTSKAGVPQLKSSMPIHGIPEEIDRDNVPFGSVEFCQFA